MRGLAVIAALLVIAFTVWIVVRAVRRARAAERRWAPWHLETISSEGVTRIRVVRRRDDGVLIDAMTVASIPDDDPDWLNKRAAAWEDAQQRATELNDAQERTS